MNKPKSLALVVCIVAGTGACSPEQTEQWLAWWEEEPKAAVAWALNECGELCTDDTNHNGIVEPDAGAWTDVTTDEDIFDVPEEETRATASRTGRGPAWPNARAREQLGHRHREWLLWRSPVLVGFLGSGWRIGEPSARLALGAGHARRDPPGHAGLECLAHLRSDHRLDLGIDRL